MAKILLVLLLSFHIAFIVTPRLYWLLAGRRCPHCAQGRVTFQGLLGNPWRRLQSWWRCEKCAMSLQESRFGLVELSQDA